MFIRVSGKDFKTVISRLMTGSAESVNFYKSGDRLYLHTYGSVLHYKYLNIIESDVSDFEVTVVLDKTVELLSADENVTLSLDHEIFQIAQNNFVCRTEISYESRIDIGAFNNTYDMVYSVDDIKELVDDCKTLDNLARALGVRYAPVNIYNGKAYLVYSNTALAKAVKLPNMSVASEVLRKLVSIVNYSKYRDCYLNLDTNFMYFKCDDDEVAVIQVGQVDRHTVEVVDNALKQTTQFSTVDMNVYNDKLALICKVYKKTLIELLIGIKDLAFYVYNASVRFEIGKVQSCCCTLKLSTEQAIVIQKLFGQFSNVSISRGDNKVCLAQKNLGKELLIAGLLY